MDALIIECIIGIIAVICFQYKNPQKTLLHTVSVFVFLLFLSRGVMATYIWAVWIWAIASVGLLWAYSIRFKRRPYRGVVDLLKWGCVALLILYPGTVLRFSDEPLVATYLIAHLTVPTLAAIFLYDRWILKLQTMNKIFVIILSVQTLSIIALLAYSVIQKTEADLLRQKGLELSEVAEQQRAHAEMAASEVERLKLELQSRLDSLEGHREPIANE